MNHYKVFRENVERVVKTTCDKCDIEIINGFGGDYYDFDFYRKDGVSYPEYQNYIKLTLDLCKDCSQRLVEDMKAQGYKFQEEEVDN